jgi:hypothetical protein
MKTALQETQVKMMWAFVAFVMALFFAIGGGACAVMAWKYGSYGNALWALAVCLACAPVVWCQGRRFERYGAEVERLGRQEW